MRHSRNDILWQKCSVCGPAVLVVQGNRIKMGSIWVVVMNCPNPWNISNNKDSYRQTARGLSGLFLPALSFPMSEVWYIPSLRGLGGVSLVSFLLVRQKKGLSVIGFCWFFCLTDYYVYGGHLYASLISIT